MITIKQGHAIRIVTANVRNATAANLAVTRIVDKILENPELQQILVDKEKARFDRGNRNVHRRLNRL